MIWLKATPKLREIREKIYSQDEVVNIVNAEVSSDFTRTWYTNIENGKRLVDNHAATVIARALDVKLDEIFVKEEKGDTTDGK